MFKRRISHYCLNKKKGQMESSINKEVEITSELEQNFGDVTRTVPYRVASSKREAGLSNDEIEPLMVEEPKKMDGNKEEDDKETKRTCWSCKYNWRTFLPVACCCKR